MRKKIRCVIPKLIKDILEVDLKYYKLSLEKLCNMIIKNFGYEPIIEAYKWSSHESTKVLNFNLTETNTKYFNDMFSDSNEETEAEFLRKIFSTYCNLHPSVRERVINKSKFRELEYIIKNNLDIKVALKNEIRNVKLISLTRCEDNGYNLIKLNINNNESLYNVKDIELLKINY